MYTKVTLHEVCCSHTSCRLVPVCFSSPETASQLQGHVHWIIEHSIKVVDAVASGHSAIVRLCSLSSLVLHHPPPLSHLASLSLPPSSSGSWHWLSGAAETITRAHIRLEQSSPTCNHTCHRSACYYDATSCHTSSAGSFHPMLSSCHRRGLVPPLQGAHQVHPVSLLTTARRPPVRWGSPPRFSISLNLIYYCCVNLTEISNNVPSDKHPNLLTLTKAAHIQGEWGYAWLCCPYLCSLPSLPLPPPPPPHLTSLPGFLSGLATLPHLPETFQRDMPPRIRPHIQSGYVCMDPYSPLTLVVPQGLSPPWRDCFIEGQKDVIDGGVLMKSVVLNARLKQCSRYSVMYMMMML